MSRDATERVAPWVAAALILFLSKFKSGRIFFRKPVPTLPENALESTSYLR